MKLLSLLVSAGKEDWHWLQKFLKSPVFNQNEQVVSLFNLISRKKNKLKNESFSEYFDLNQPAFPYLERAKFHHISNYLLQRIEEYFAWNEWWNDRLERQRTLLRAFRKRGLDRFFRETLDKLRWEAEKEPLRNADFYRFQYHLALEDYQHSMHSGPNTAEQLQPLTDLHDLAFIAEKLRNACGLVSRQRVLRMEPDLGLLPHILEYVRTRPQLLEHPAVAVYYHGYMALTEPEEERHFFELKKQLPLAASRFPLRELGDAYFLAVNFCIHRINLRQEAYLNEVFDLYKNGLEMDVYLDNGQISRFTYTNIAMAGLRLRQFDWVHAFLMVYREKLPETQRQGAFAFNLARYHCERGDYDQAMPLLLEMDFDDVLHNLTAKAMLTKMYFETGATTSLNSLLNSFGAYLRRKRQVSEQQKSAYLNFIRLVRKLQSTPKKDKKAMAALSDEIRQMAPVAEKDWLLRML